MQIDMGMDNNMQNQFDDIDSVNQMGDNDSFENDSEFDAGVEADVNTDPKKYIQQLTGKLSQELRNYNNGQENQDSELNKYVAGMIIPQATKSMTDDDKTEVINKIQKNSSIDDDNVEQNESLEINNNVNEINNSIVDTHNEKRFEKKTINRTKNNPFVANR